MKSWDCAILDSFFWEPTEDLQEVDVSFVPMMLRRRCSQFTKLCFAASQRFIAEGMSLPIISVSKYGEIQRQYAISKKIIETQEVSPTAFSLSVFNTAIGLLGISLKNHASAQAFSTMSYQLEAGLIHALSFLENHREEEKLLLLVGEERLPEAYQNISAETNTLLRRRKLNAAMREIWALSHLVQGQMLRTELSRQKIPSVRKTMISASTLSVLCKVRTLRRLASAYID